ncbi:Piwi-domain-containing protein [Coprinopsis marcescibilis]|uniref:Piwi-domain-containing protein n=1 Tax=Coprinopsis marcescibilis TaxID=230819 RepID=A0A5C3KW29_COPMA|nr:Piwi-domain-containing protein [Coprinopsis marcescibilis]
MAPKSSRKKPTSTRTVAAGGGKPSQAPAIRADGAGAGAGANESTQLVGWTLADRPLTVAEKRPAFGVEGKQVKIIANCYRASVKSQIVYHYDGTFSQFGPAAKRHPPGCDARLTVRASAVTTDPPDLNKVLNIEIILALQHDVAPDIFTHKASYDGRKNLYSPKKLSLSNEGTQEFFVPILSRRVNPYRVSLQLVGAINQENLDSFVFGTDSLQSETITGIMTCNVAIRMVPSAKYPFRGKSFFIRDLGTRPIGGGIELCRGLFQSLRPGIDTFFVNVDITAAMMYLPGSLLDLCIDFIDMGRQGNPSLFCPEHGNFKGDAHRETARFVMGLKVTIPTTGSKVRIVRGLTSKAANQEMFHNGTELVSVAQHFANLHYPLRFPGVICALVGKHALVPLELCNVLPNQFVKRQIPPNKTSAFVSFSKIKPEDRFEIIQDGVKLLEYSTSPFLQSFGMDINTQDGPLDIVARQLMAPKQIYGGKSTETPFHGSWNMKDKKVHEACDPIIHWIVAVFATTSEFDDKDRDAMVTALTNEARKMGIVINARPVACRIETQSNIPVKLREEAIKMFQAGNPPQFFLIVLPDNGSDYIRIASKFFGNYQSPGIATQCVKSGRCKAARPQYWANVMIQLNAKLGGINCVPEAIKLNRASGLGDPVSATMVMGADVTHPSPGSGQGDDIPPSFAAVVWSVDLYGMKYNAKDSIQPGRQEIILDLKQMVKHALKDFQSIRKKSPAKLIFYRDGVSEGQFKQVKEDEVMAIKGALLELEISQCKLTYIIVGKRHHIRFHAVNREFRDPRSENALAGTVVDTVITHPIEFDFYLLSHGGILGTSRPAHYTVLYDENGFSADKMQEMSYCLCHGYASATRSVSIPIPVYYADKACEQARYRFPPRHPMTRNPNAPESAEDFFQRLKKEFDDTPLSAYASKNMYFAVRFNSFVQLK